MKPLPRKNRTTFSFGRLSLTPALSRWQRHLPKEKGNYLPTAGKDG